MNGAPLTFCFTFQAYVDVYLATQREGMCSLLDSIHGLPAHDKCKRLTDVPICRGSDELILK